MPLIKVKNFSYYYDSENTPTLEDISFEIESSDFIVLAGRSASGKSTLASALAGYLFQGESPYFSGEIVVNHTDMTSIPLFDASKRVAYVQQNPEDQFCTLTVKDELAFGLENLCFDPLLMEEKISQTLAIVQGTHLKDRELATLSGGEKQKIAIASMLALSPDVLILDEPTSNLDPQSTQQIFDTLYQMIRGHELTVIIIEHKLAQLRSLNPKLLVLEAGQLLPINDISSYESYISENPVNLPALKFKKAFNRKPIIKCEQVCVNLGNKDILKSINLEISSGEFVALSGPNGSGKTSLLNTLMGFYHPDSGRCFGLAQNLSKTPTSLLVKQFGMVFQNPDHQIFTQSIWDETVLTAINLDLLDEEMVSQADIWLRKMGLAERKDDHPQRLSYGEKRRLNVLSVLLHQPVLLLLDEFLIGQDMANARAWMSFFKNFCEQNRSVLLVTHHEELTRQYCDRLLYMNEGRVIVDAPVGEAYETINAFKQSTSQAASSGGIQDG